MAPSPNKYRTRSGSDRVKFRHHSPVQRGPGRYRFRFRIRSTHEVSVLAIDGCDELSKMQINRERLLG